MPRVVLLEQDYQDKYENDVPIIKIKRNEKIEGTLYDETDTFLQALRDAQNTRNDHELEEEKKEKILTAQIEDIEEIWSQLSKSIKKDYQYEYDRSLGIK